MIPDDPGATDKTDAELDAEQEAERSEFADGFDIQADEDGVELEEDDPRYDPGDVNELQEAEDFAQDHSYPWWGPDE